MIVSRGALAAGAAVAKVDGEPVVVRADGAVLALNRFVALTVGPLPAAHLQRVPLTATTVTESLHLEAEVATGIVRDIARDRRFGGLLEHADMRIDGADRVEVEMTDGVRRRTQVLKRLPRTGDAEAIRREIYQTTGQSRVVLNRKRLQAALDALDAAAPDTTGEAPVWVEFDAERNAVLLRAVDYRTSQRSAVRVQGYRAEAGKWLERDGWEGAERKRGCVRKVAVGDLYERA